MRNPLWIYGVALVLMIASNPARGQVAPPEDLPIPKPEPLPANRAMLGIRAAEVTESAIREFGLTVRQGALISALLRGSPAERAGLPLGGVIVAVDGVKIESPGDLVRAFRSARPGHGVELKYYERERLFRKTIAPVPYMDQSSDGVPMAPAPAPLGPTDLVDLPPPPPSESVAELSKTVADLQTQIDHLHREIEQLKRMIGELLEKQPESKAPDAGSDKNDLRAS